MDNETATPLPRVSGVADADLPPRWVLRESCLRAHLGTIRTRGSNEEQFLLAAVSYICTMLEI